MVFLLAALVSKYNGHLRTYTTDRCGRLDGRREKVIASTRMTKEEAKLFISIIWLRSRSILFQHFSVKTWFYVFGYSAGFPARDHTAHTLQSGRHDRILLSINNY